MIAIDTNILVHAHRSESPHHEAARHRLHRVVTGVEPWAIPWPCIHEFLAVVTGGRALRPPTPRSLAQDQVQALLDATGLVLLSESTAHWSVLRELLAVSGACGALVHDARIAALCIEHGVQELWTADRDFQRFPGLRTYNPLVEEAVHDASPSWAAAVRARTEGRRRAAVLARETRAET